MTSLQNLYRYAKTGVASKDMTSFDKLLAMQLAGDRFPIESIITVPPISFQSDGSPLISLSMKGNGQNTGTPSPDNIIMPTFCGKLVGTDWTIPITCAGQTVPVYLGQTQTVRRIKKLVLTGEESLTAFSTRGVYGITGQTPPIANYQYQICSHYGLKNSWTDIQSTDLSFGVATTNTLVIHDNNYSTAAAFKSYLAEQNAEGTPVTVWYVLATPTTGIVNEPLAKIGTYADELSSTDAGFQIPTANGNNVLTIGTDLQPSSVSITGHIIES